MNVTDHNSAVREHINFMLFNCIESNPQRTWSSNTPSQSVQLSFKNKSQTNLLPAHLRRTQSLTPIATSIPTVTNSKTSRNEKTNQVLDQMHKNKLLTNSHTNPCGQKRVQRKNAVRAKQETQIMQQWQRDQLQQAMQRNNGDAISSLHKHWLTTSLREKSGSWTC